MRNLGSAPGVEDRAQDVRHMRKGDDAMLVGNHPFGHVEIDQSVSGDRHDVYLVTGKLPRDDVVVMLKLGQQHTAASRTSSYRFNSDRDPR